ncbi:hypothetical protein H632_c291p1 [Helicosporidium sp. ATCC 50920]|nr:hypothetical protein H632_c291p1 [Helicosporidium sp. ATCC 50920]|eukprot:KDD76268.1 hypothetical protein H632_c291p1 [Helicosporidium sp. ATCC 50920]
MTKCPICLRTIAEAQRTYVDPCYHRYCYSCICKWTTVKIKNSGLSPDETPPRPTCVLCRTPYQLLILEGPGDAFNVEAAGARGAARPAGFVPSHAHVARRQWYAANEAAERGEAADHDARPPHGEEERVAALACATPQFFRLASSQTRVWLVRELEALLLSDDVDLLAELVLGTLRLHRKRGSGLLPRLRQTMEPYLGARSAPFALELLKFACSGQSLETFDRKAGLQHAEWLRGARERPSQTSVGAHDESEDCSEAADGRGRGSSDEEPLKTGSFSNMPATDDDSAEPIPLRLADSADLAVVTALDDFADAEEHAYDDLARTQRACQSKHRKRVRSALHS